MIRFAFLIAVCSACTIAQAQFSIYGTVISAETNDPLVGATVQVEALGKGTVTNLSGEFELHDVPRGKHVVQFSFLGFKAVEIAVEVGGDTEINQALEVEARMTDEVIVYATRASDRSPTTFTNVDKAEIQKQNFGQDLPFVLNWTPSLVTTSDAGAGIGYTGLRIRGSDATRINVTINGIPFNDSESQGVFWVDVPDIATSTQSIQVQRGVGTSTNGAGAFGASINLQTNTRNVEPYADVINTFGSFNTRRHTAGFGTGLINDRFVFDGRASLIKSDGFIDRASSDLKSYYFSGGFYGKKSVVKAIVFGGNEVTYQSWYGVPESRLNDDVQAMLTTAATEGWNNEQTGNLLNSNTRTFNFYNYDNQVDDYSQDHYQLHFSHRLGEALTANTAVHYTYGRGFYEEFKFDDSFSDYGLSEVVIGDSTLSSTDLVRRRWLDNDFYGVTYSFNYERERFGSVLGGAWNRYEGDHFGEIIWAAVALNSSKDYRYYFSTSNKRDFNLYWKNNFQIVSKLNAFLDVQWRRIDYTTSGIDNDMASFNIDTEFNFFNPKLGITYSTSPKSHAYASIGVAQREPVRDDFINAPAGNEPKPEELVNLEAGWKIQKPTFTFNINYYFMDYRDQLVLTGELNDVGAAIRTNVDRSYRTGLELEGGIRLSRKINWRANIAFSQNKIRHFTDVMYDYGVNYDEYSEIRTVFEDTDISFSPNVVVGSSLTFSPVEQGEIALLSKYVGMQFLDNTSNDSRSIDEYLTHDLRLTYGFKTSWLKEARLSFIINNILDKAYSSNGYTYGFIGGGEEARQNYYYPQAGRNYMLMASLRF